MHVSTEYGIFTIQQKKEVIIMTMGEYIKKLRTDHGYTQEELGQLLNPKVNRAAINKWEGGRVANIKRSHIAQMAKIFDVDPVKLMCFESIGPRPSNAQPLNDSCRIPLVGRVAAGQPIFDEGNIIGEVFVDPDLIAGSENVYALKVRGDSMSPKILDGDTLIVREQSTADDGEIVIVTVNGDEGTCKKLKRYPDALALVSINPLYEPIMYTWEEVEQLPVRIVGKVLQSRHDF